MKVLHITPTTDGYEEVTLLKSRISKTNGFALIEKDGEQFMTGGFLLVDNIVNRTALKRVIKELHYSFIQSLREVPYVFGEKE
jgi:hypothetical protein